MPSFVAQADGSFRTMSMDGPLLTHVYEYKGTEGLVQPPHSFITTPDFKEAVLQQTKYLVQRPLVHVGLLAYDDRKFFILKGAQDAEELLASVEDVVEPMHRQEIQQFVSQPTASVPQY